MHLKTEPQQENARISDFGDIIPVNFEPGTSPLRKHQKWTMAEQKKLSNFISARKLEEIKQDEWDDICSKLNRTHESIFQKAQELATKMTSFNKKRKITEANPLSAHNESISSVSLLKVHNFQTVNTFSEVDNQTDLGKSDLNNVSRKNIITTALRQLSNQKGTKKQM